MTVADLKHINFKTHVSFCHHLAPLVASHLSTRFCFYWPSDWSPCFYSLTYCNSLLNTAVEVVFTTFKWYFYHPPPFNGFLLQQKWNPNPWLSLSGLLSLCHLILSSFSYSNSMPPLPPYAPGTLDPFVQRHWVLSCHKTFAHTFHFFLECPFPGSTSPFPFSWLRHSWSSRLK